MLYSDIKMLKEWKCFVTNNRAKIIQEDSYQTTEGDSGDQEAIENVNEQPS